MTKTINMIWLNIWLVVVWAIVMVTEMVEIMILLNLRYGVMWYPWRSKKQGRTQEFTILNDGFFRRKPRFWEMFHSILNHFSSKIFMQPWLSSRRLDHTMTAWRLSCRRRPIRRFFEKKLSGKLTWILKNTTFIQKLWCMFFNMVIYIHFLVFQMVHGTFKKQKNVDDWPGLWPVWLRGPRRDGRFEAGQHTPCNWFFVTKRSQRRTFWCKVTWC